MKDFLAFKLLDVFIMLINVKMPTIAGILTFMSMIKFMHAWAWSLIKSEPDIKDFNSKKLTIVNLISVHALVRFLACEW